MQSQFQTDTYAVMGNPVAHSKSPFIHTEFAKQTAQQLHYIAIEVPLDKFNETVLDFQKRGGKGLSITVPFKLQAFALVEQRSERAQLAQAVNTIFFKSGGQLFGDNTDGIGLINDLENNENFSLQGKKILIVGAGGATQGVILPLLTAKPEQIFIANRTVDKAEQLVKHFSAKGKIASGGFDKLSNQTFDLIINATSASLTADLPPLPSRIVTPTTLCYDMAYGNKPTVFMAWGKQQGAAKCLDGLGMLVEQAAEQFYLWRGVRPKTQPVIKLLREYIKYLNKS